MTASGKAATVLAAAGIAMALSGEPAQAMEYKEAPALAAAVREGRLPPVAQRVGEEPEVVTPLDAVGRYGGQIRFGLRGSSDHNHILRMVGNQGLVRWDPQWTKIVPNLAKSYEVDPTGRVFTFRLRRGVKWSDGTPFTVEDVVFNVRDLILNPEYDTIPQRYVIAGKPMQFEVLDDVTVRFTFAEPYGDFLAELASPLGQHPVLYAKHYCSQFHARYNPNVGDLARAARAADWKGLLQQKCGDIEIPSRWSNPERPTLDPWVMKEPYVGGATRILMERNPYFWQVDTAGNQLPYVDQLSATIAQDVESLTLAAIGGRIDFGIRHLDVASNRPVLAESRQKGGYEFVQAAAPGGTDFIFALNLTHKDRELRELFNTKDFRVALSLGFDRKTIIETVMLGEGEPWQQGPFEEHPNFHRRLSTQFLDFDQAKANALLDGIGLTRRAPDGTRLMPSGRPVRFKVDVIPTFLPEHVDILGMMRKDWARIGVTMDVNAIERTLFFERTSNGNDHDAAVWNARGSWSPGERPQQIVPLHQDSRWGIAWSQWYNSAGRLGEEPPATIRERFRLYDEARATVDPEKRTALILKIADIAADQFEVFGLSKAVPTYGIRKATLRNVPKSMPNSWYYPTPAPTLPQTWSYAN